MKFTAKHFNPEACGGIPQADGRVAFRAGDRPEDLHIYDPKTILALNVSLATRRPLLISGEPGSGKSTLARSAAAVLGWRYYK
jgi:MoxR-like ATPase